MDRGQALLGIPLVQLEMLCHKCVEQAPRIIGKRTLFNENLAEGLLLIEDPSMHRRNQLVTAHKLHLEREDAKQEITVHMGTGHRTRTSAHSFAASACIWGLRRALEHIARSPRKTAAF